MADLTVKITQAFLIAIASGDMTALVNGAGITPAVI